MSSASASASGRPRRGSAGAAAAGAGAGAAAAAPAEPSKAEIAAAKKEEKERKAAARRAAEVEALARAIEFPVIFTPDKKFIILTEEDLRNNRVYILIRNPPKTWIWEPPLSAGHCLTSIIDPTIADRRAVIEISKRSDDKYYFGVVYPQNTILRAAGAAGPVPGPAPNGPGGVRHHQALSVEYLHKVDVSLINSDKYTVAVNYDAELALGEKLIPFKMAVQGATRKLGEDIPIPVVDSRDDLSLAELNYFKKPLDILTELMQRESVGQPVTPSAVLKVFRSLDIAQTTISNIFWNKKLISGGFPNDPFFSILEFISTQKASGVAWLAKQEGLMDRFRRLSDIQFNFFYKTPLSVAIAYYQNFKKMDRTNTIMNTHLNSQIIVRRAGNIQYIRIREYVAIPGDEFILIGGHRLYIEHPADPPTENSHYDEPSKLRYLRILACAKTCGFYEDCSHDSMNLANVPPPPAPAKYRSPADLILTKVEFIRESADWIDTPIGIVITDPTKRTWRDLLEYFWSECTSSTRSANQHSLQSNIDTLGLLFRQAVSFVDTARRETGDQLAQLAYTVPKTIAEQLRGTFDTGNPGEMTQLAKILSADGEAVMFEATKISTGNLVNLQKALDTSRVPKVSAVVPTLRDAATNSQDAKKYQEYLITLLRNAVSARERPGFVMPMLYQIPGFDNLEFDAGSILSRKHNIDFSSLPLHHTLQLTYVCDSVQDAILKRYLAWRPLPAAVAAATINIQSSKLHTIISLVGTEDPVKACTFACVATFKIMGAISTVTGEVDPSITTALGACLAHAKAITLRLAELAGVRDSEGVFSRAFAAAQQIVTSRGNLASLYTSISSIVSSGVSAGSAAPAIRVDDLGRLVKEISVNSNMVQSILQGMAAHAPPGLFTFPYVVAPLFHSNSGFPIGARFYTIQFIPGRGPELVAIEGSWIKEGGSWTIREQYRMDGISTLSLTNVKAMCGLKGDGEARGAEGGGEGPTIFGPYGSGDLRLIPVGEQVGFFRETNERLGITVIQKTIEDIEQGDHLVRVVERPFQCPLVGVVSSSLDQLLMAILRFLGWKILYYKNGLLQYFSVDPLIPDEAQKNEDFNKWCTVMAIKDDGPGGEPGLYTILEAKRQNVLRKLEIITQLTNDRVLYCAAIAGANELQLAIVKPDDPDDPELTIEFYTGPITHNSFNLVNFLERRVPLKQMSAAFNFTYERLLSNTLRELFNDLYGEISRESGVDIVQIDEMCSILIELQEKLAELRRGFSTRSISFILLDCLFGDDDRYSLNDINRNDVFQVLQLHYTNSKEIDHDKITELFDTLSDVALTLEFDLGLKTLYTKLPVQYFIDYFNGIMPEPMLVQYIRLENRVSSLEEYSEVKIGHTREERSIQRAITESKLPITLLIMNPPPIGPENDGNFMWSNNGSRKPRYKISLIGKHPIIVRTADEAIATIRGWTAGPQESRYISRQRPDNSTIYEYYDTTHPADQGPVAFSRRDNVTNDQIEMAIMAAAHSAAIPTVEGGRHPSKKSRRSKRNGTQHKRIKMGRVLSRKHTGRHLHQSHRKPAAKSRRYTQRRKSNK